MAEKICNLNKNKIGGGMSGMATQLINITANGTFTIPSINEYALILLIAENSSGVVAEQVTTPSMVSNIQASYYLRTTWANQEAVIKAVFNSATSVTVTDKSTYITNLKIIGVK